MVLDASVPHSLTSTDNDNGHADDNEDHDSTDEGSSDDDDNEKKSNSYNSKLGRRLQISHLLKMVLQDAQTRLFFKAQSVIQSDIRHFVPKVEDLAYPDVLVGMLFFFLSRKET